MDLRSLLAAAGDGDQKAWDTIVRRYSSLLWGVARSFRLDSVDASDVVQVAWLRLVENLDEISEPQALPGWLVTTVRRECLQLLRRRRHQHVVLQFEMPDQPDQGPSVDHALLSTERDVALWRKLGELSETCQQLLRVLMATPPPSYTEVAAALDMPIGSIGPTRQSCLRRLRELVSADELLGDRRTTQDGGRS